MNALEIHITMPAQQDIHPEFTNCVNHHWHANQGWWLEKETNSKQIVLQIDLETNQGLQDPLRSFSRAPRK